MEYTVVLIDNPAPHVRRVTLNRPEKRNALNSVLRQEIITAVREGETDPDVRVTVIAANGPSFCAGYDLTQNVTQAGSGVPAADYPYAGAGGFQRSVVDLWTSMWDLSKPVIAQVHGHCLAGGSELATGCDLVYVAEDARIGARTLADAPCRPDRKERRRTGRARIFGQRQAGRGGESGRRRG